MNRPFYSLLLSIFMLTVPLSSREIKNAYYDEIVALVEHREKSQDESLIDPVSHLFRSVFTEAVAPFTNVYRANSEDLPRLRGMINKFSADHHIDAPEIFVSDTFESVNTHFMTYGKRSAILIHPGTVQEFSTLNFQPYIRYLIARVDNYLKTEAEITRTRKIIAGVAGGTAALSLILGYLHAIPKIQSALPLTAVTSALIAGYYHAYKPRTHSYGQFDSMRESELGFESRYPTERVGELTPRYDNSSTYALEAYIAMKNFIATKKTEYARLRELEKAEELSSLIDEASDIETQKLQYLKNNQITQTDYALLPKTKDRKP